MTPRQVAREAARATLRSLLEERVAGVRTAVLVGCGKAKADAPAKARELYTSQLFAKSVAFAELVGDAVFVLSGAHGLVELDELVAPYDHRIFDDCPHVRRAWGVEVLKSIVLHTMSTAPTIRVVVLAGARYVEPIATALEVARKGKPRAWMPLVDPLRGLMVGERLSVLGEALRLHAKCKRGTDRDALAM